MTTLINKTTIQTIAIKPKDNGVFRVVITFISGSKRYKEFSTKREAEDFIIKNFHTLEGVLLV